MVGHVQILFLNNLNFCKGQNDFSTLNIYIYYENIDTKLKT